MNNNNRIKPVAAAIVLLQVFTTTAFAADGRNSTPLLVNPAANSRPGAAASGNVTRSGNADLTVKIINSCFGTNLRSVANPLSPTSTVEARLKIAFNATETTPPHVVNLNVTYPADLVTKGGVTTAPTAEMDPSLISGDISGTALTGVRAGYFGNMVQIVVPHSASVNLLATGDTEDIVGALTLASAPEFIQHTTGGGQYMGTEGPLTTGHVEISASSDNKVLTIRVPFPGQEGFCGGYHSPLMLFFDKARPKFSGTSAFSLSSKSKTFWVEANAPGSFLAYDRNHNGMVDGKEELFGNLDSEQNGFDALKELDSNHDGVIDRKDSKWKDLVLWNDKNGDGVSQKGELEALSKRVVKLSLKYRNDLRSYGETAQARQTAEFWFKEKGKTKKGTTEDIWFAPASSSDK